MSANNWYTLNIGDKTFDFRTPADTKNTAGSTAYKGTNSLYLIGAITKDDNSQTYSASGNNYIIKDGSSYKLHTESLVLHGYGGNSYITGAPGVNIHITGGSV